MAFEGHLSTNKSLGSLKRSQNCVEMTIIYIQIRIILDFNPFLYFTCQGAANAWNEMFVPKSWNPLVFPRRPEINSESQDSQLEPQCQKFDHANHRRQNKGISFSIDMSPLCPLFLLAPFKWTLEVCDTSWGGQGEPQGTWKSRCDNSHLASPKAFKYNSEAAKIYHVHSNAQLRPTDVINTIR